VKLDDIDKTERCFLRHGPKAVLIRRLVPVVRSLISIPAGAERMSLGLFLRLIAAGSLVWNTVLIFAGYQLGERWHLIESPVGVCRRPSSGWRSLRWPGWWRAGSCAAVRSVRKSSRTIDFG
jgi:uncharacterized membrane protein YdjX (TVP38/TMEM64 family)